MASKWNYNGDVNLEHGGYFWRRENPNDDFFSIVDVIPESDMGGPDNVFGIQVGTIYITKDVNKLKAACECVGGEYDPDTIIDENLVDALKAYWGTEVDTQDWIQIGVDDPYAQRQSNVNPEQINGNWRLKNYVKKHYLMG